MIKTKRIRRCSKRHVNMTMDTKYIDIIGLKKYKLYGTMICTKVKLKAGGKNRSVEIWI